MRLHQISLHVAGAMEDCVAKAGQDHSSQATYSGEAKVSTARFSQNQPTHSLDLVGAE